MSQLSFSNLKSRMTLIVGLGVFLLTATLVVGSRRGHESAVAVKAASGGESLPIAGPGRVEPASEDIKIGSELSGRLKVVNVEEGDAIRRGVAV